MSDTSISKQHARAVVPYASDASGVFREAGILHPLPVSDITGRLSMFSESVVVERQSLVELRPQVNVVSDLRNVTGATGTAAVSVSNSEFNLSTGGTASSTATLDSAERGRYQPGYAAECGVGVRLPDSNVFAGTASARWGYFDANDGFGFGKDATGVFVFIRRSGTETKTYQSAWSVDHLDGEADTSNPSGLTLDLNRGNIFQISYSWYGYGNIAYQVVMPDTGYRNTGQRVVTVHVTTPDAQTSVVQPNLPIRQEITNGDQATDYDLYVGGRQYSVVGRYEPNRRITTHVRSAQTITAASGWEHVMSFRRKSSGSFAAVSAKLAYIQALSDQDAVIRIKTNATLTNASWGNPSGRDGTANETALEVDTSATVSGGVVLAETIIDGGRPNNASASSLFGEDFNFDMIENQPLTVEINTYVNGTLAAGLVGIREDW